MTETAWPDGPTDARLTWDDNNALGSLAFIGPDGELAVVPVTAGDADAATAERNTNVWHIDVAPGAVDGPATVSPSIHYIDRWHSPNPVTFTLVAELAGETPAAAVVLGEPGDDDTGAAPDAGVTEPAPGEAPSTQEPAPGDATDEPPPATAEPAPVPVPASPGGDPGAADAGAAGEAGAPPAPADAPADTGMSKGAGAAPSTPPPFDAGTTDVAAADTPKVGASVEQPAGELIVTLTTASHVHTLPCAPDELDELAHAMELAVAAIAEHAPRP